jgi:hypothetical protein
MARQSLYIFVPVENGNGRDEGGNNNDKRDFNGRHRF